MKLKLLAAAVAFTLSAGAQAALLVDNFTQSQAVGATGANTIVVSTADALTTGTSLSNAFRTLTAHSVGNAAANETVTVYGGLGVLEVANNSFSTGKASVLYTFDATDFTAFGTAILLDVLTIDLGVAVKMLINGVADSGFQTFTGPGTFYKTFASFTNPAQFTSVTSLQLDFQGSQAWDGTFNFVVTDNPPSVPEPATLGLLGLGLLGLGLSRRKRA
ncbi:MAG: PEP-CTERM sorting domain-containing protein [Pseudomonadota bacterium]|nr:PEP-CTERM sorting domain-containing protein [Pseudomonadota bacterium]